MKLNPTQAAPPISTRVTETISGHNFNAGQVLAFHGSGYELVDCDPELFRDPVGMIAAVDGDEVTIVTGGHIEVIGMAWTPGEVYFCSETVAGGIQATAVSVGQVEKPILLALTATTGIVLPMRGTVKEEAEHTHDGVNSLQVDGAVQYNKSICDILLSFDPQNLLVGLILEAGSIFGVSDGSAVLETTSRIRCNFSVVGIGGREEAGEIHTLTDGWRYVFVVYNPTTEDIQLYITATETYTPLDGYTKSRLLGDVFYDSTDFLTFLFVYGEQWQPSDYKWMARGYDRPSQGWVTETNTVTAEEYPTLYRNRGNCYEEIPTVDVWKPVTYRVVDANLAYLFLVEITATEQKIHVWKVNPDTKAVTEKIEWSVTWALNFDIIGFDVDTVDSNKIYYVAVNTSVSEQPHLRHMDLAGNTETATLRLSTTFSLDEESAGVFYNGAEVVIVTNNKDNGNIVRNFFNATTGVRRTYQLCEALLTQDFWHVVDYVETDSEGLLLWDQDNSTLSGASWTLSLEASGSFTVLENEFIDLFANHYYIVSAVYDDTNDIFTLCVWNEETFAISFIPADKDTGLILNGIQQLSEIPGGGAFGLPQNAGRTLVAKGIGDGLTGRSIGDQFGEEEHAQALAENAPHTHRLKTKADGTVGSVGVQGSNLASNVWNTDVIESSGSGTPHNNMQPSTVATLLIYAGKSLVSE